MIDRFMRNYDNQILITNVIYMYQTQTGFVVYPLKNPQPLTYTDGSWMKQLIKTTTKTYYHRTPPEFL